MSTDLKRLLLAEQGWICSFDRDMDWKRRVCVRSIYDTELTEWLNISFS